MTLAILGWIHIPIWLAYLGYAALAAGTVVAAGTAAPGCATTDGSTTPPDGPMCGGNDMECNPEDAGQRGDLADSFTPADQLPPNPDLALPPISGVYRSWLNAKSPRSAAFADFRFNEKDRVVSGVMGPKDAVGDGGKIFNSNPIPPDLNDALILQQLIGANDYINGPTINAPVMTPGQLVQVFDPKLGDTWVLPSTPMTLPKNATINDELSMAFFIQNKKGGIAPNGNPLSSFDNNTLHAAAIASGVQCIDRGDIDPAVCFAALDTDNNRDIILRCKHSAGEIDTARNCYVLTRLKGFGQHTTLEGLDGNKLLAVEHGDAKNGNARLTVYNAGTGQWDGDVDLGFVDAVRLPHVAVSRDSKRAAVASALGELKVIDLKTYNLSSGVDNFNMPLIGMAPNGLVVSSVDSKVWVAVNGGMKAYDFTDPANPKDAKRDIQQVAYEMGFCIMIGAQAELRTGGTETREFIVCAAETSGDGVMNDLVAVSPDCRFQDGNGLASAYCP